MRRSDREITNLQQIQEFVRAEQILRVAFVDDEEIYIVPVNYGYVQEDDRQLFYFHGAQAGRRYTLSQSTPLVGFEIDGNYRPLTNELACKFSAAFQSVIGTGRVQLVTQEEEKIKGLNAIMAQVSGRADWQFPQQSLAAVAVYRLEVHKMTCKGRLV